jgi:hypothetical protein
MKQGCTAASTFRNLHLPISFGILVLILLAGYSSPALSQDERTSSVADSLFSGVWKGTSLCQVKNSPCHDEEVVYYIAKAASDRMDMRASKIVNGQEVEMGNIQFQFDPKTRQITSVSQPNALWKFTRNQNALKGTLYYNDALYRIIEVTRR